MKKRLEILVRLVDGGQLYWDAATVVDALSPEEVEAMLPKSREAGHLDITTRKAMQAQVREKFREAADILFERVVQKVR